VVLHAYKPPSCEPFPFKATYQRVYPPSYQSSHEFLKESEEEQSEEHTGKHIKKSDERLQEEAMTEMPWSEHPPMEIHCEIKHVKRDDELSYEALSYTWRDPHKTAEISIGDTLHSVRRNLWEAMCSLSRSKFTSFPRYLWIDALCINQNDTRERNHQVAQMGRIYRQAKTVLVWLGADTQRTQSSLQPYHVYLLLSIPPRNQVSLIQDLQARCSSRYSRIRWSFTRHLYNQEYWTRPWIIQEVVLAANIKNHVQKYNSQIGHILTR
jgi:hypothetical protein